VRCKKLQFALSLECKVKHDFVGRLGFRAFLQLEQFRSEKKHGKVTKLKIALKRQIIAKHLNQILYKGRATIAREKYSD